MTETVSTVDPPLWSRWTLLVDGTAMAVGVALAAVLLDPVEAVFAGLWWIATIVVIRSDLTFFIIPDTASAVIAGLGLLHAVGVAPGEASGGRLAALADAALGGVAAFAMFWLTAFVHRRLSGRRGLGFGDVKLAGACGVWLGFADQAMALEIAALAAIAVVLVSGRGRAAPGSAIPFGAFLAPAAWLVFVAGPALRQMVDLHG